MNIFLALCLGVCVGFAAAILAVAYTDAPLTVDCYVQIAHDHTSKCFMNRDVQLYLDGNKTDLLAKGFAFDLGVR